MIQSTHYAYGSANIIGVPKFTDRLSLDVMWLLTGRTLQGAFLGGKIFTLYNLQNLTYCVLKYTSMMGTLGFMKSNICFYLFHLQILRPPWTSQA